MAYDTKPFVTVAIDRVVSEGLAPVLRKAGFKRASRKFHRAVNDVFHIVHVQSSLYSVGNDGRFTVNLKVASELVHQYWCSSPLPKSPASLLPIFSQRIGHAMPEKRDTWWDVNPTISLDELARTLGTVIATCALPFFERFPSTAEVEKHLETDQSCSVQCQNPDEILAILKLMSGKREAAERMLREYIRSMLPDEVARQGLRPGCFDRALERIREMAKRMGISI